MLFDSSVRKDLARSFGATLVVMLTIVLTMMLIRTLGQAAGGQVSPEDVVLLLGYAALGHLPTMLSLSLFVAIVVTLGRMYRDSEMAVWFASGVGLNRFVRPVLRVFWPVLLVVGLMAFFVWPWVNRQSVELKDRYEQRSDLSRVSPGVFQTSRDGSKVFFVERHHEDGVQGRNVFILTQDAEREAVTTAHQGHIQLAPDGRYLVLDQGQRNETAAASGERMVARFEQYRILVSDRIGLPSESLPPHSLSTLQLLAQPNAKNQGELVWRMGLPLAASNLLLLGIGLSAANPRRASNWNLLLSLLSFIVYYNMINLTQAWVASSRYSMGAALLALHGTAFVLGLALLWWRDNGTTLSLRRSRPCAVGAKA